jgi:large subunit ribosomal protein L30
VSARSATIAAAGAAPVVPAAIAAVAVAAMAAAVMVGQEEAVVAEANHHNISKQPVEGGTLRITWVRSSIGAPKDQKATIKALGLNRLQQTVEHPDNLAVRGQVYKVRHLLQVEEV